MNGPTNTRRYEARWPVALAVCAVLILLLVLPERVRLFSHWFNFAAGAAVLGSMAAVRLTAAGAQWLRVERTSVVLFFLVKLVSNVSTLAYLIGIMASRQSSEIDGLQLLASSTAVWVTNVLGFSLLYWQIDRGGPAGRAGLERSGVDWLFPQESAPAEKVSADWRPAFVDYLYLGYSTATAFSTTDAMPLSTRAKLLMMLESTISLLTIVVIAARAINILGS